MTHEMKEIFDNYEISYEKYDKFVDIFERLSNESTFADYEFLVNEEIIFKSNHYLCEDVAAQFYREGRYKELIKKMYSGIEKMKAKLKEEDVIKN